MTTRRIAVLVLALSLSSVAAQANDTSDNDTETWTSTSTTDSSTFTTSTSSTVSLTTSTSTSSTRSTMTSSTSTMSWTTSTFTSSTVTSTTSFTLSTTSNFTTTTGTNTSRTTTSRTSSSTTTTTRTHSQTSSTRSTSTVSSTTSSTSTTTFVYKLAIVEAQLSPEVLKIVFNYPARLSHPNATWDETDCDDLWEDESERSFGLDPSCKLSDDRESLEVSLGHLARVQVGDRVSMNFGVLLPDDVIVVEATELSQTVTTRARIIPLQAVLLSADSIQACSTARFSLAASTGFAQRAPVIHWQLGNGTEPLRDVLQTTLDEANRQMLQILEIPPMVLYDATSLYRAMHEEEDSDWELEIVASISNWQAQGEELTASVTVIDTDTPFLQLMPSMKRFHIFTFEEVEMEVDIFPPAPLCTNLTVDVPDQPSVQWEYLQRIERPCTEAVWTFFNDSNASNFTQNASDNASENSSENSSWNSSENVSDNYSNDSNWSNSSHTEMMEVDEACVDFVWQRIENLSFVNLNRRPGSLRLPAFSLRPDSSHQFRAAATFEGYSGKKPTVIFTVHVQPRTRPVAIISGPSEVSVDCPFNLSGEESYDASSPPEQRMGLDYSWSCLLGEFSGRNETEILDAEFCEENVTEWNAGRPTGRLQIQGGVLDEGIYTFMLQVRPVNATSQEPPGEAWWVIRVRSEMVPLVFPTVPWVHRGLVSVRAGVGPAVARVSGSASCPMPNGWTWHWLLIDAGGHVLALLDTTLYSMATFLEVRTSDFRGDLLMPDKAYAYALVGADQTLQGSALSDFHEAGALVWRSPPFLADAPPRDGLIELVPRSGEAFQTHFAVNTFGWSDAQESHLSYSFFRFPLPVKGLSADGLGGILMEDHFKWSLPKIEWTNTSSEMYFRKQGGLALRTWDSNGRLADLLMAEGDYFIVVRVRDPQGGEGTAAVLGPVVVEPVNATDLSNVLQASFTSGDAESILNTVDAVGTALPMASLLGALEVASGVLEPSAEALEKMSQVLSSTVSGARNRSELFRAADIFSSSLLLAKTVGVTGSLAISMLQTLSVVNEGGRLANGSSAANFTQKIAGIASEVADAAWAKLETGELFLSGVTQGKGLALQLVSRVPSSLEDNSLQIQRLFMPPSLLRPANRRLQALDLQGCNDISIKTTYWTRSNPYTWADMDKGMNQWVWPDATATVLEFDACGTPLAFNETIPERTLRLRAIALPARRPAPRGYEWDVICTRWSEAEQAWVVNGVEVEKPVYWDSVEVSCVVYEGSSGMTLTAVFFPIELTTTTTTLEWTHPTYTTFEAPPTPPVLVVSCGDSALPEPPLGQVWQCTRPGEGQECRATCRGYPNQMKSVTCLKGLSSLEWYVTNICPEFTTTTLDLTVEKPSDNAILGTVLVFVWIVVFCCSAGVAGLLAWGLYKFTMNEPMSNLSKAKKAKQSQVSMAPQELEVEEDEVDPAFMDWVRQWAENPKVETAVLERKVKGSKSQEALALPKLESEDTQVPEETEAAEVKDPAFTRSVQLEFSAEWKAVLEGILFAEQISLQGEGRLYYVVNTVGEILKVKDLASLHKVNFPLTIVMQEAPPQVEKAEGFYFWQVEWGALKGSPEVRVKEEAEELVEEEKEDGTQLQLPQQRQAHEDLMAKWKQSSLRQLADPRASRASQGRPSGYPQGSQDPLQKVLDKFTSSGHVKDQSQGGSLAATAAQASYYVPDLQDQLYKDMVGADDGWLEVQSPSGRLYYWNQFTFEEWEPPQEPMDPE